jgi:hypothetical protein
MTGVHFSALGRGAIAALLCVSLLSCGGDGGETTGPVSNSSLAGDSPTLLQCPSSQTFFTLGIVGVLGGVVDLGGTLIDIPAGALTAPTLITITIPASRYMEIGVRANRLASFLFQEPVSITIDYSRCSDAVLEGKTLTVWQINPFTNQFIEHMGGTDDRAAKKITFETGHLSGYAIAF